MTAPLQASELLAQAQSDIQQKIDRLNGELGAAQANVNDIQTQIDSLTDILATYNDAQVAVQAAVQISKASVLS